MTMPCYQAWDFVSTDGAHAGTLTKDDAADLLDFTSRLLDRMYTEPARLKLAEERRDARRKKPVEGKA